MQTSPNVGPSKHEQPWSHFLLRSEAKVHKRTGHEVGKPRKVAGSAPCLRKQMGDHFAHEKVLPELSTNCHWNVAIRPLDLYEGGQALKHGLI